jgi:hypothetical protein
MRTASGVVVAAVAAALPVATGFQASQSWLPRGAAVRGSSAAVHVRPTLRARSARSAPKMVAVRHSGGAARARGPRVAARQRVRPAAVPVLVRA